MVKLFLGIEIFIFILSCLIVIKNIFSFFKILWLKQGKFELNMVNTNLLYFSISYIITLLIIGF